MWKKPSPGGRKTCERNSKTQQENQGSGGEQDKTEMVSLSTARQFVSLLPLIASVELSVEKDKPAIRPASVADPGFFVGGRGHPRRLLFENFVC